MSQRLLALNCGSSSVKFACFTAEEEPLFNGQVESIGSGQTPRLKIEGVEQALPSSLEGHAAIIAFLLEEVIKPRAGALKVAGHRVVHGGTLFEGPALIDRRTLALIESLSPLAPAHQPHHLAGIDAISALDPGLPQVACFDTAFHRTIPEKRQRFALPKAYAEKGLRRFGFHGLSYQRILQIAPDHLGDKANGRLIICHLGNGCSLAAVKEGQSAYTSMGFTPLDGLIMGRRPGRLDPGALLWLMEEQKGNLQKVSQILNQQSGLLGISGLSSDMRSLLASQEPEAQLAIEMFLDRLVQEIASAAAAIGGMDALIFTGGIGENAAVIRAMTLEALSWLGLELDEAANQGQATRITKPGSPITALVLPTNEEAVIARMAANLVDSFPS